MTMASGRVAYLNGAFVPETEAKITLFDSQNHVGDMVHENTRTFGHRPFKLREHMERLYYSMAAVEIDCGLTIEQMEEVTLELLNRNEHTLAPEEDCFFIHDVSRGPHEYYAEAFPEGIGPIVGIYLWPLATILANRARTVRQRRQCRNTPPTSRTDAVYRPESKEPFAAPLPDGRP